MDCTLQCKLIKHGHCLTSAVTSENLKTLQTYIPQKCANAVRNRDPMGRNILHIASSIGHLDILGWLCEELKIGNVLQTKDKESGWTALHRSVYYGHIDCAVYLFKKLLDWRPLDFEGNSPLDLIVLDSPKINKKRKKRERHAKVILPFEAAEAGELTLHHGDIIEIIAENRTGWGVGRQTGRNEKGLFPLNFVEELPEKVDENKTFPDKIQSEVFLWGSNINFTLGIGDSKNRNMPEHLETFTNLSKNVLDVVITKFHSMFLTDCGEVWTCGVGLGGRLGHGTEDVCFVPKLIATFQNTKCIAIAAGNDHSMVLTEMGVVYTFGLNEFHQLGHLAAPKCSHYPKEVTSKSMKNNFFIGISAARFHSVIYTKQELYTFGLNAGQLGYSKGPELQTSPKLVSYLYKKERNIVNVIASDGATLCLMADGDLYILQDFICRKISIKLLDIKKICMAGGALKSKKILCNKPESLKVAVLHKNGMVEVWRSSYKNFKKCRWFGGQNMANSKVIDISLGRHMILVTDLGYTYFGHFHKISSNNKEVKESSGAAGAPKIEIVSASAFSLEEIAEKYSKERKESEEVHLEKVPLIYRGLRCYTDWKTRTFAVVQDDPRIGIKKLPVVQKSQIQAHMKNLLASANEQDQIHDLLIKAKSQYIPCHRFILESRLGSLENYTVIASEKEKMVIDFSEYDASCVKDWLSKVYCGNDQVDVFPQPSLPSSIDKANRKSNEYGEVNGHTNGHHDIDESELANKMISLSTLDFENPLNDFAENVFDKGKKKSKKSRKGKSKSAFEVYSQHTFPTNGNVIARQKKKVCIELKDLSSWRKRSTVSDIILETEDGKNLHCHKSVLVARLDYFDNMLNNEWMEASLYKEQSLKMAIPEKILNVVIHYLYTDDVVMLRGSDDISFIGEVLVCADQLLIFRLKEICEVILAEKVNMKNAVEIFQFSCAYNARQLLEYTCEFIALNLAYFLESRLLEDVSIEDLSIFSQEYRSMVNGMDRRRISPSSFHTDADEQDRVVAEKTFRELKKIKKKRNLSSSSTSSIEVNCGGDKSVNENNDVIVESVFEERTKNSIMKEIASTEAVSSNGSDAKETLVNKQSPNMWKTSNISNISSSPYDLSQNQNKVPNAKSTTSPPFKKISQKERKRQISINETPTEQKESERKMASTSKAQPTTVACDAADNEHS